MQQNKKFLRVLCSLLAAALAAWCTVLLCRWVGYDLQERLGNTPSYEIINDDYSQIIDIPAEGLTQAMPLTLHTSSHSVRSVPSNMACVAVGNSAPNTRDKRATQMVKRRWRRFRNMAGVCQCGLAESYMCRTRGDC